jgi:hypothetical protein
MYLLPAYGFYEGGDAPVYLKIVKAVVSINVLPNYQFKNKEAL